MVPSTVVVRRTYTRESCLLVAWREDIDRCCAFQRRVASRRGKDRPLPALVDFYPLLPLGFSAASLASGLANRPASWTAFERSKTTLVSSRGEVLVSAVPLDWLCTSVTNTTRARQHRHI